jgi:N6-adenosine-specific RNA methylase IME4
VLRRHLRRSPWPWETWGGDSGKVRSAPDNHYRTSPLDEIAKLPIAQLAAEDCALLLWCTGPHIAIGTHVKIIEAWGFKPSTVAFDWVKQTAGGDGLHTGMGCYTRSNAEPCLLAIKGSPTRLATDVHQVVLHRSASAARSRRRCAAASRACSPDPTSSFTAASRSPAGRGNEIPRGQMNTGGPS